MTWQELGATIFLLGTITILLLLALFLVVGILLSTRFVMRFTPVVLEMVLSLRIVRQFLSSHPKMVAFLRSRFSPAERFGLHLLLGFAASLLFAWMFFEITEEIKETALILADRKFVDSVALIRTPLVTAIFAAITFLGDGNFVTACSLIVVLFLLMTKKVALAAGYAATLSGGGLLNWFLKAVFMRFRPVPEQAVEVASGWSFPSGHAMISVIFYGMLLYLLFLAAKSTSARVIAAAFAMSLVLLIGLSRVYLGVHYLTDVAAGYSAGLFWLTVSMTATETYRRHRHSVW